MIDLDLETLMGRHPVLSDSGNSSAGRGLPVTPPGPPRSSAPSLQNEMGRLPWCKGLIIWALVASLGEFPN